MEDYRKIPHWYALYTRPRFEKKVALRLQEKGLESYLPLQTVQRQWSDRRKFVKEPLFSCYVFVRIPLPDIIFALRTYGVVRAVAFNGPPSPIPDSEIEMFKNVLQKTNIFETAPYVAIGQTVEVVRGPFAGIRGRLLEHHGSRKLLISIEQIKQAITIELNDFEVRHIMMQSIEAQAA